MVALPHDSRDHKPFVLKNVVKCSATILSTLNSDGCNECHYRHYLVVNVVTFTTIFLMAITTQVFVVDIGSDVHYFF